MWQFLFTEMYLWTIIQLNIFNALFKFVLSSFGGLKFSSEGLTPQKPTWHVSSQIFFKLNAYKRNISPRLSQFFLTH